MKLSLIVPMYNEENRTDRFLIELISFCRETLPDYEILFVDDGSTDNTKILVEKIVNTHVKNEELKIISYSINKGKGYAVKKGVENSKGDLIIFIDADGSIRPNQINLMLPLLEKYDLVIGDRYSKLANIKQPKLRGITGDLFNSYVNLLFNLKVKDTLCGFKGFTSAVANDLFSNLLSNRWIFDVEILYKARRKRYSIFKLPLTWEHKEDTKMSVIDPIKMGFRLLKLRLKI